MSTRTLVALNGLGKFLLMVVTIWWVCTGFGWTFAAGSLAISGLWFVRAWLNADNYLHGYENAFNRMFLIVPIWLGVIFGLIAASVSHSWLLFGVSALSVVGWGVLYIRYRYNKRNFKKRLSGPLRSNVVMNPDPRYIKAGWMALTTGGMAARLGDAVGHVEIAVPDGKGGLAFLSCHMKTGLTISPVPRITKAYSKEGRQYVFAYPEEELTDDQLKMLELLPAIMMAENKKWRAKTLKTRNQLIDRLWLPAKLKARLKTENEKFTTGYDWKGLLTGRRAQGKWTCIGACVEVYLRLGVLLGPLGTGFFGLGLGWGDPLFPTRLLSNKAIHTFNNEDCARRDAEFAEISNAA